METKHLQSWDAFEEELHALESSGKQNPTSFRGQSDAKWQLRTTLERFMEHAEGSDKVEMLRYYNMIASVKNRIETFTSNTWELPDGKGFIDFLEKSNNWFGSLPGLEYMAYLRHHGYPSPLLDWSRSPYIAAYFAFRDVYSKAENVAIFSYTLDLEILTQ